MTLAALMPICHLVPVSRALLSNLIILSLCSVSPAAAVSLHILPLSWLSLLAVVSLLCDPSLAFPIATLKVRSLHPLFQLSVPFRRTDLLPRLPTTIRYNPRPNLRHQIYLDLPAVP